MEALGVKKIYKGLKKQVLDEHPWAIKAKEATSSDSWGPTGTQLKDLAKGTGYGPEVFNEIFNVLFLRLDERDTKWRKCYKALVVLDFLLLRGDEHCVHPVRIGRFGPKLREVMQLSYLDPKTGRDVGASIRQKAKDILELTEDEEALKELRRRALQTRDCVGISSNDQLFGNTKNNRDLRGERYTVGRNNSVRDEENSKNGSPHNDWGKSPTALDPPDTSALPRSFIGSPDVHQVTIGRDRNGRVSSVEGKKLDTDQWTDKQEYYGGFISSSPLEGNAFEVTEGQADIWGDFPTQLAKKPSHRKLVAPPGRGEISQVRWNGEGGQSSFEEARPAGFLSGMEQSPASEFSVVANPLFEKLQPQDANFPSDVASTTGTPPPAAAVTPDNVDVVGQVDKPEEPVDAAEVDPSGSDLIDWTSKVGFDFTKLNLDSTPSPYKTPPSVPHPNSGGPSMRSMSAGKKPNWESFS